jgi:hypothetical protein
MKAKFTVVIKNGAPWLKWNQYETTYLKIWKANSNTPYVKYNGITAYLEDYLIKQLREMI